MFDEDPNVRLWAAAHSLEWTPQAAQVELERLIDNGGMLGFEAETTLKEYQKGRLSFGPGGWHC
jgi:hypothetical protein